MELDALSPTYILWAVALGGLSAASLPLGSAVGLGLTPGPRSTGTLAAFGAGALIAALALELVAPAAAALHAGDGHALDAVPAFVALLLGAVAGGLLFVILDRALAERGGFLRKISTSISWYTRREADRHRGWLTDLCAIPLLRALPAERVGDLVRDVRPRVYADGEELCREGDPADFLFFLRSGRVAIARGDEALTPLGAGGILGELPLLTGSPHAVSARALGTVEVLALRRDCLETWRHECPEFDAGLRRVAQERLEEIRMRDAVKSAAEERWGEAAVSALRENAVIPDDVILRRAAGEHPGSGLAVWLGLLIDGVPESIVIGSGLMGLVALHLEASGGVGFAEVVPYTLIAGLFLSNFPEALSSSVAMRAQGMGAGRVLGMWTALLGITALGAGIGYAIGGAVPHVALVVVEGLAAGAMLTTIASTMIPEAVHLSGSSARAGLATLAGFLAAVTFKLLE
jgi:CRP-like cAMP-binding protein